MHTHSLLTQCIYTLQSNHTRKVHTHTFTAHTHCILTAHTLQHSAHTPHTLLTWHTLTTHTPSLLTLHTHTAQLTAPQCTHTTHTAHTAHTHCLKCTHTHTCMHSEPQLFAHISYTRKLLGNRKETLMRNISRDPIWSWEGRHEDSVWALHTPTSAAVMTSITAQC